VEEKYPVSRVPWGLQPSLKDKTNELGINFDKFIEAIKLNRSDSEMAEEFGVSERTIAHLREHFERYGLQSIVGRD